MAQEIDPLEALKDRQIRSYISISGNTLTITSGDLKSIAKIYGDHFDLYEWAHENMGETYCVVHLDKSTVWYKDGKVHRDDDLPAYVASNGDEVWYKDGEVHREHDLPAVKYRDGELQWLKRGKRHRLGGPAVVMTDGEKYWFVDGRKVMLDGKQKVEYANPMNRTRFTR